jgi:hypothetical protein
MLNFSQCYDACETAGHFPFVQRQMMEGSPHYVHEYNENEILMPTPLQWQNFKCCDEFQKILPAPITRTTQTCNALRGFKVYSVLMSDGDRMTAQKMLTKDENLILMVQAFDITEVLPQLKMSPQALNVHHTCYSVLPVPDDLSDHHEILSALATPLLVTTFHFIYSVHASKQRYQRS